MTYDDYRELIGQIRHQFSSLVYKTINRKRVSGALNVGINEEQIYIVGMYLDFLECYFIPVKVIATGASGESKLTLYKSVTRSDYSLYIGHVVSGEGIADGTIVTNIDENYVYLSKPLTASVSNTEFTIGENCWSFDDVVKIVYDINRILGTNYIFEGYWTEFDLDYVEPALEGDTILLYGSSPTILTGAGIYGYLYNTTISGDSDVEIIFNFTLEYPYFAYPATLPDLSSILDQEGDDVLASGSFEQFLLDVQLPDSSEVQYKVYRTDYITTIPNKSYTFKF